MDNSPPTPPCPPLEKTSYFDGSADGSSTRKKPRTGTLFPPLSGAAAGSSTAVSNTNSASSTPSSTAVVPKIAVNGEAIAANTNGADEPAYVWAEVKDRARTLIRYPSHERLGGGGTTSASASCCSSVSSSRSTSPAPFDDRRQREDAVLTGKGPSTPIPATPILRMVRQQSFTKEKVIVGIRLRPLIAEDERNADVEKKRIVVDMRTEGDVIDGSATVQVQTRTGSAEFSFDHGFANINEDGTSKPRSDQAIVYRTLAKPLVQSMVGGVNCSFFAYGQTGSGKTYSTLGVPHDPGVVPRFCRDLLDRVAAGMQNGTCELEISYYEIYNENIIDLLGDTRAKLRVREHRTHGPFIENLLVKKVAKYSDIEKLFDKGNAARHKASTLRNDGSSRSHAVFSLKLEQMANVDGRAFLRKSKANFVDLAGSERPTALSMANSDRLNEMKNINKSLTHLGVVIMQLAKSSTHISYRDSVLTWLLKDSLGGNAKTVMLATIAPLAAYADETHSTLRYASNAYKIYNKTYVNEDPAFRLIEQLRAENDELKAKLAGGMGTPSSAAVAPSTPRHDFQVVALNERIETLETLLKDKDAEIELKDAMIRERDADVRAKEIEIQDKSERIRAMNHDHRGRLQAKDQQILEKEVELSELKSELAKSKKEAIALVKKPMTRVVGTNTVSAVVNDSQCQCDDGGGDVPVDLRAAITEKPSLIQLLPESDLNAINVHFIDSLSSVVGRSANCTISLNQSMTILDVQCTINRRGNRLYLLPNVEADIFVNGHRLISAPSNGKQLHDGDRLGLGKEAEYLFSVSIPHQRTEQPNVSDISMDKIRAEYWRAKAEFFYFKGKEDVKNVLIEQQRRFVEDLVELTGQAKKIVHDVIPDDERKNNPNGNGGSRV